MPPTSEKRFAIRVPMPSAHFLCNRNRLRICRASSSIDLWFAAALILKVALRESSIFRIVKLAMGSVGDAATKRTDNQRREAPLRAFGRVLFQCRAYRFPFHLCGVVESRSSGPIVSG